MGHVAVEMVYESFEAFDKLDSKITDIAGRGTTGGSEAVCAALNICSTRTEARCTEAKTVASRHACSRRAVEWNGDGATVIQRK